MSEEAQIELPQYQCHKRVRAGKIEHVELIRSGIGDVIEAKITFSDPPGASTVVSGSWFRKHQPNDTMFEDAARAMVDGYYVVYEDGYTSFSPQRAFEHGYSRIHPVEIKPPEGE